ncbi:hypothetical protein FF38_14357 [Lucilia cuprina]|uniref:Uncharacterized protein n=1 Tax=Lucilia cuprina TaxID=7375 RepID=A0A0L0CG50_LUCCU|nr:hypothetical protein CVS40_4393 [Lucilia cuprina]KNC31226.1 hypothetical protein FF38_14357 [Lucilia cuprina]
MLKNLQFQEDHPVLGPTSKLPLYKPFDNVEQEHNIVAGVYERPSLKAPYDSHIVRDILAQSKRYQNLKPQAALQILGERRSFEYFKKFAISHLESNVKKQFRIFFKMIVCKENAFKPSDELAHSIFSWNWNDFLTRRRLKNFVWVDVLLRTEEKCLHIYKFQKDLEQLQVFVEKIFDGLFSNMGKEDIDIYQHIEKPIDEAKKVLHTTDYVEDELFENTKDLKQLIHKEYFLSDPKRYSEEKFIKTHLENRILNSHIWDPIEMRFQLNWFRNIVQQNQYRMDSNLEKYQSDIVHYRQLLEMETFINGNCLDYCYSSIEVYKNRINEIQDKFDKEYDAMENKLIYKRLQIDKLREQRQFLSQEIQRFHEEEEVMRLRIEREEKEKELQRVREAEELAAKQMNKKKGQKGKKTPKNTKTNK